MKQQMELIKTRRGYDAAIARLSALMDEDMVPGSARELGSSLLPNAPAYLSRRKVCDNRNRPSGYRLIAT